MAPEVMADPPQEYTFAADIWSFGCLVYILLSGMGPFDYTGEDPRGTSSPQFLPKPYLNPTWTLLKKPYLNPTWTLLKPYLNPT